MLLVSDSLLAVADGDSDDRDVKWNSFFFDFALSGCDLPSLFADTRAFFLRPLLAVVLPVLPLDNPDRLKRTTPTIDTANCKTENERRCRHSVCQHVCGRPV